MLYHYVPYLKIFHMNEVLLFNLRLKKLQNNIKCLAYSNKQQNQFLHP